MRRGACVGVVAAALLAGVAASAGAQAPGSGRTPTTFRWAWQRTDLLRYNRVEGVSVGARGQLYPSTPLGPLSLTATVRLGSADREPNARLDVTRETLSRRITLSAYRELAAAEEEARHLGLGNSLTAALFGRDDGDYYQRSGAAVEWTPPAAGRRSFAVRAYAERHDSVSVGSDFALLRLTDDGWAFRPSLGAEPGWDVGGMVTVAPRWGTDSRRAQGGLDFTVRAAAGSWDYRSASLTGRLALPFPGDFRLAVETGGGTSWGAPPEQRRFAVGGASTLRGYEPRELAG
ncbi:MAG: hypothetical protein Q8N53_12655, partial [Longimicrobiales bacterium]|nr:hypothetical protein [Longimicrobiales bacterium]